MMDSVKVEVITCIVVVVGIDISVITLETTQLWY